MEDYRSLPVLCFNWSSVAQWAFESRAEITWKRAWGWDKVFNCLWLNDLSSLCTCMKWRSKCAQKNVSGCRLDKLSLLFPTFLESAARKTSNKFQCRHIYRAKWYVNQYLTSFWLFSSKQYITSKYAELSHVRRTTPAENLWLIRVWFANFLTNIQFV